MGLLLLDSHKATAQCVTPPLFEIAPAPLNMGAIFLFVKFCLYNGGMMNENYNTPNSPCCGRPFVYSTKPKCNYNDCCLNEYKHTMPACIRNKQPDCTAKAVIPAITVETTDGLMNLANCFVHVTKNNTTYYIDDKHRPMMVWAGNVEVDLPADVQTPEQWTEFINSFSLRSQFLYVKFTTQDNPPMEIIDAFYFTKTGKVYWAGEFDEVVEE